MGRPRSSHLSDAAILAAINRRSRIGLRGATVADIHPDLPSTLRWMYARFSELEQQGLIARIPGRDGEFTCTALGLQTMGQKDSP